MSPWEGLPCLVINSMCFRVTYSVATSSHLICATFSQNVYHQNNNRTRMSASCTVSPSTKIYFCVDMRLSEGASFQIFCTCAVYERTKSLLGWIDFFLECLCAKGITQNYIRALLFYRTVQKSILNKTVASRLKMRREFNFWHRRSVLRLPYRPTSRMSADMNKWL